MLPFLLPNSVFCARATTSRASSSLSLLANRSRLPNKAVFQPRSRQLATDATESYDAEEDNDENIDFDGESGAKGQGEHVRWLMTQGAEFRRPNPDGPNWLGGNVPFPLNPSFKPPPPIGDKIRTQIFNAYMKGQKNEAELSKSFGLSVSRIKAILRLKKLEQLWIKGRVCQYRFQMEMEGHLGVTSSNDPKAMKERHLANSIDLDVDTFAIGQSKRLQRVFYEVVPEGEQPPLAQYMDLEEAIAEDTQTRADARRHAAKAAAAKGLVVAPVSLLRHNGKPYKSASKYSWFYPAKAGRPPYTFVDVGHRYLANSDRAQKEEKEKALQEKKRMDRQANQLKQAHEAHKLEREILHQQMLLTHASRSEMVRRKREEQAKQQLALRRAKAEKVTVNL